MTAYDWANTDSSVCRVVGKRKDGLYTLRVSADMLAEIQDEFGVDDPNQVLADERNS